ncbi:glycoside hydrolase [Delitschia confertaspora ATCC 74209]|uniref:Glycoside hydrolase n=1 Tax=Delitschia confertaspora ATCC 74209 TaxID=1513339 RepID=A0A9P4MWM6_9PLEO|nr:glycoside hydrolase [Delitschia confertaspora ATCC 74209]
MKSFFRKAKSEWKEFVNDKDAGKPHDHHPSSHNHPTPNQSDQPSCISPPTPKDIFRYRYHHGTNLGSIYVLERWLHPSMFPDDTPSEKSSELEAVKAWVDKIGVDATREKFEHHWSNAVSDDDLVWLRDVAKCTTIRLPLGFFSLSIPRFTLSTPFSPYITIYQNCWTSILTLLSRLRHHSIAVLLDLHALPGGANTGDHSGTNSGSADLWTTPNYLNLSLQCAQFLAQEIRHCNLENVSGIQLVNESIWDAPNMYAWYDSCIAAVSAIDPTIPVYISDGWNLGRAVDWTLQKNTVYCHHAQCPVLIDTHLYWAFSDADKAKSPQQIIAEVPGKLSELDGKDGSVVDRGAVDVIVGEYSNVLSEDSWSKPNGVPKEELVHQFGQAQSHRYQTQSAGSFFWTYKMDWSPGGEWGFLAQVTNTSITPPPLPSSNPTSIPSLISHATSLAPTLKQTAVSNHISYWDSTSPGQPFEHAKYEAGWTVGFQDALSFFSGCGGNVNGGSKIGCLESWVLKRIKESGFRGPFVWEFEQGLRKGIVDFSEAIGM